MYDSKPDPHYFDSPPAPAQFTLTRVDIPTSDLLVLVLRLNAVQLLIVLLSGGLWLLLATMWDAA